MKKYIGAIDQGTTSTRFILFDHDTNIVASHQLEHKQIFSKAGWVEHDPLEIWQKTKQVIKATLQKAKISEEQIAAIGITNQRETTVIWNQETGNPYYNAIVWQDTRTDKICRSLKKYEKLFQQKTGLPIATYFSGPKIKWLLDNVKGLRNAAENGEAIFGNMDSWITWNITGGKHITDVTNASRIMLMDLKTLDWDDELLEILDIPKKMLPKICSSSEIYGKTKFGFDNEIPISGILGDQQAALFGQTCFRKGDLKNTYGTGCFILLNTGNEIVHSKNGLLTTVGYQIKDQKPVYALEGSVAIAGSLIQWIRDNFSLITESHEINDLAEKVTDNGGVYFVPAFSGLFAPYWNSAARGTIIGLTHFVNKSHLARSVLEATAFQTRDVFEAMQKDSGLNIKELKVDGGMTASKLLMQFQADILNASVILPNIAETTALGAAYAAGLAVGFWKSKKELQKNWKEKETWHSNMTEKNRNKLYDKWHKAVKRSLDWEE
ncbi:MAG: glycerol kinase GlpK [Candidatus Cloacimonetes bacterium]|jgi:glycerol kinase|nr:glycerol kinase GlpK [Candidatus Cloacimonadota bacterium]